MMRVTAWLKIHRIKVLHQLVSKKRTCPPKQWRVVLLGLDQVAEDVITASPNSREKQLQLESEPLPLKRYWVTSKNSIKSRTDRKQVNPKTSTDWSTVFSTLKPFLPSRVCLGSNGHRFPQRCGRFHRKPEDGGNQLLGRLEYRREAGYQWNFAKLFGGLVPCPEAVLMNSEETDVTLRQSDLTPVFPKDLVKQISSDFAKLLGGCRVIYAISYQ